MNWDQARTILKTKSHQITCYKATHDLKYKPKWDLETDELNAIVPFVLPEKLENVASLYQCTPCRVMKPRPKDLSIAALVRKPSKPYHKPRRGNNKKGKTLALYQAQMTNYLENIETTPLSKIIFLFKKMQRFGEPLSGKKEVFKRKILRNYHEHIKLEHTLDEIFTYGKIQRQYTLEKVLKSFKKNFQLKEDRLVRIYLWKYIHATFELNKIDLNQKYL